MITSKLGNKSDIQAIVIWACSWHLWIWLWQLINHSRADKPLTLIRFCRHSAPEQDLSLRFPLLIMLVLPWLAEEGNTKQPEMGCVELTSQANLKLFCTFPQRSKRFSLDRRLMLLVSVRKQGAQLPSQQPFFLMALMCFIWCLRNCYHSRWWGGVGCCWALFLQVSKWLRQRVFPCHYYPEISVPCLVLQPILPKLCPPPRLIAVLPLWLPQHEFMPSPCCLPALLEHSLSHPHISHIKLLHHRHLSTIFDGGSCVRISMLQQKVRLSIYLYAAYRLLD